VLDEGSSLAMTYDMRWNLLCERRLDGTQVAEYVHGLRTDEILAASVLVAGTKGKKAKESLQTVYPLADGLGTTVALTNEAGEVLQRYRYTAFGQPSTLSVSKASVAYRFLFTGREWLAGVGLNEHRNRYYQPGMGRWLTTDPIGLSDGENLYLYCKSRPVDMNDPTGLVTFEGEETWAWRERTLIRSVADLRYIMEDGEEYVGGKVYDTWRVSSPESAVSPVESASSSIQVATWEVTFNTSLSQKTIAWAVYVEIEYKKCNQVTKTKSRTFKYSGSIK
jgi:RHS repeat-associated protein